MTLVTQKVNTFALTPLRKTKRKYLPIKIGVI